MAKPKTLPYCQGLSLWERWHGVSRDGEGKPASKRQIYEKALVFQGENLERREPVKFKLQGTRGTTLFAGKPATHTISFWRRIAAPVTVGIRQSLLSVQLCRSGASNRSPPHCLAPPGSSLKQKKIVFSPSTHLVFVFQSELIVPNVGFAVKKFGSYQK